MDNKPKRYFRGGRCGEILSFGHDDEQFDGEHGQAENISSCLDANYYKGNSNGFGGLSRQTDSLPTENEIVQLNNPTHSNAPQIQQRIRRLTEIECERLQGLPDNFTALGRFDDGIKPISSSQRYKTLGNAMTVNVITAIITRMLEKGCLE